MAKESVGNLPTKHYLFDGSMNAETGRCTYRTHEETLAELRAHVEEELIRSSLKWVLWLIYSSVLASVIAYGSGSQELSQAANPALMAVVGGAVVTFAPNDRFLQVTVILASLAVAVMRHAIYFQGCSACVVPCIFGFYPCAAAFVLRCTRAVAVSSAAVLILVAILYAIDLGGYCPSQPMDPNDKGAIIADRLMPIVMLIVGNSAILFIILRQSQESAVLHAKAAQSAVDMANMRRDMLHRLTHELRTPLNGLVGSVELLTVSDTMTRHDMENVQTVQRCLASILAICDNVLVAAKYNYHHHDQELPIHENVVDAQEMEKPFALASCVDAVAEIFAASAHAKGLELKVEFCGDTKAIMLGVEIKLRQCLLNLVGNSLKFTQVGTITLRVKTTEVQGSSGEVMSNCYNDDDDGDGKKRDYKLTEVYFEVQDSGVGLDPKDAAMLFEPFHQGEEGGAYTRRHQGTGLGLTICKELIESMGGEIAVDGARGKGSRFYFTLLLKQPILSPSSSSSFSSSATTSLASAYELGGKQHANGDCQVVIVDAQTESLETCRSIVKSVDPASVITFASLTEVTGIVTNVDTTKTADAKVQRIAFVAYDPTNNRKTFSTALSRLHNSGWIVFVYCGRSDFADVVNHCSNTAVALFQRPLPLLRMEKILTDALDGNFQPMVSVQATGKDIYNPQTDFDGEQTKIESGNIPNTITSKDSTGSCMTVNESTETDRGNLDRQEEASAKIVVVDDTKLNVRLLVKMLSRSTKMPVLSFYNGQSAIDLVASADSEETMLFLLDWHMPVLDGIATAERVRELTAQGKGPHVYICMLTADIEGLDIEMARRQLACHFKLENGTVSTLAAASPECSPLLDLVAGKPTTFKTIQTILTWFHDQI